MATTESPSFVDALRAELSRVYDHILAQRQLAEHLAATLRHYEGDHKRTTPEPAPVTPESEAPAVEPTAPAEPVPAPSDKPLSTVAVMTQVLKEANAPLHYRELTERVVAAGALSNVKSPIDNISANLSQYGRIFVRP